MTIWSLADNEDRCPRCLLSIQVQGHRSTIDGEKTGCKDSGELGLILARQRRDEGMSRTTEAHPSAVDLVDAAIMRRVKAGRPFSANLIRAELASLAPSERPVIGARMNSLARTHCVKVGEEPSTDPATHGKALSIWVAKSALQEVAA
jgi:hypothetical protein